ncbi:MAG TPA: hypothetical protein PLP01_08600 [Phycisphaerae bacterium]|nr:hypothetical protein [Phycisphaerae bacterium]
MQSLWHKLGFLGLLASVSVWGIPATAQQEATPPAVAAADYPRTVVLDASGPWRMHHTLKPPLLRTAQGLEPALMNKPWLDEPTADPATDWAQPEFDDGPWMRGPALKSCRTPYLSRLCLRGKFEVTDPAKVTGLTLSAEYHGGLVVYLNGREVVRRHVGAKAPDGTATAEEYPADAFLTPRGQLISPREGDGDKGRRIALRKRSAESVTILSAGLRKGVNVLAVEMLRAPYPTAVRDKADPGMKMPYQMGWNTCEVISLRLTADTADGLVPNVGRPSGLRAWNQNPLASDFDMDIGDPCEAVRPVSLCAARNGAFSGKVVLGSDKPIRGLKAVVSDLAGDGGTLPASSVAVRYGFPWGDEYIVLPYTGQVSPYTAEASLLEGLAETPLEEYPVRVKKGGETYLKTPKQPDAFFGAVVPVWITVRVPADAKPGLYKGRVTLSAADEKDIVVPLEVTVVDWSLPKPDDYRTWVELIQSPDSVAIEYGVPLWSEKHWELIARSFAYFREVGSRVVYVPLIAQMNQGNEQSMVRWIDKGNGTYEHDFSVMEKYLDAAEKAMGKPRIVIFNVWEVYMVPDNKKATGQEARAIVHLKERDAKIGRGPCVTIIDAKTGQARNEYLPPYADGRSKGLWGPLYDELLKRMKRRGLYETMTVGTITDAVPTKEEVQFVAEMAPNAPWVCHSHHGFGGSSPKALLHGLVPVMYQTRVWNVGFPSDDPSKERQCGWKSDYLLADYERNSCTNDIGCTYWRHLCEYNIAGSQRGVGRLGADFWDVIRDKRGNRKGKVWGRYPESSRRNLDLYTSLLAAAPEGPVATARYEAFREGLQECEARIFIERALTDKAQREILGDDLADRCQKALDERIVQMYRGLSGLQLSGHWWDQAVSWRGDDGIAGNTWFAASPWRDRSQRLYRLAAEVGRKLSRQQQ